MSETTTIQVSKNVWMELEEIKRRNGYTSFDSVLRILLMCKNCARWIDGKCTETTLDAFKVFPNCFLRKGG